MPSLFRTSEEAEARTLTRIGVALVLVAVVLIGLYRAIDPFARKSSDYVSVAIEMPYVGQGVASGTPLIMHGVKVGEVVSISNMSGGGVRLQTNLDSKPTQGLTDSMGIDFRPSNYFGVTGINLTPGDGGKPLRSGAQIDVTPKGNYALQALLYRLGEVSAGAVTPRLISVIDRATRYTDALNPLLETMLVVGTSVTNVQNVSTERLLRNSSGVSVALPGWADGVINVGDELQQTFTGGYGFKPEDDQRANRTMGDYDAQMLDYYNKSMDSLSKDPNAWAHGRMTQWVGALGDDVFGAIGKLADSHIADLFPVVEEISIMANTVPKLVQPLQIADTLRELRTRLERMYQGSGDQRALQVRIVLDSLPGVGAPLGLLMGGV